MLYREGAGAAAAVLSPGGWRCEDGGVSAFPWGALLEAVSYHTSRMHPPLTFCCLFLSVTVTVIARRGFMVCQAPGQARRCILMVSPRSRVRWCLGVHFTAGWVRLVLEAVNLLKVRG